MAEQVWLVGCDQQTQHALAAALRQRGSVAVTVDPGDGFPDLFGKASLHKGCVVFDATSPAVDASVFMERLASRSPPARCVALVDGGDVSRAISLMKAGAADVLEKSYSAAELAEAIQKALPALASRDGGRTGDNGQLSDSELRLVRMTVAGISNPQIARELGVSLRTVAVRRAKVMQKVGASSRAELIRIAVEAGWC